MGRVPQEKARELAAIIFFYNQLNIKHKMGIYDKILVVVTLKDGSTSEMRVQVSQMAVVGISCLLKEHYGDNLKSIGYPEPLLKGIEQRNIERK